MPFPMRIQPIDADGAIRADQAKPVVKSRLKRLFERQFPSVLRISSSEKLAGAGDVKDKDRDVVAVGGDFEPSSVVLDKMVRSFIEDSNEKSSSKCGRNHRGNCFQGNCDDSSDDDLEFTASSTSTSDSPIISSADAGEVLKVHIISAPIAQSI